MIDNYLLLLIGITVCCFTDSTVAREVIIGGDVATANQFPYQAALIYHNHGLYCGGAIMGNKHIITAAHCVVSEMNHLRGDDMSILVGTDNYIFYMNEPKARLVKVDTVFVPTAFDISNMLDYGDIAVLQLKESLQLLKNHHLKNLVLPYMKQARYGGKTAVISGFGWSVWEELGTGMARGGNYNGNLHYAEADVLRKCDLGSIKNQISSNHLCAQIKQRDPSHPRGICHNDIGGPLVYAGTLIGIASLSVTNCTEKDASAIYVRVSMYLNFIHKAMKYDGSYNYQDNNDIRVFQVQHHLSSA